MLVGPFGIDVGREGDAAVFQHSGPRYTRIQPYVQDVGFFAELGAAAIAMIALRHQFFHRVDKPEIGAFFHRAFFNKREQLVVHLRFAAFFAVQHGDGRPPEALAGQTPIGAQANHRAHPFFAAGGIEFNVGKVIHQFLAQVVFIDAHKPLFRRAENNGVVAAPAVRIAVGDFLFFNQGAQLVQFFHHQRVGVKHVHSFKHARFFGVAAFFIHGAKCFQAPLFAGAEVVLAVAGSDMHDTHPRVHRYEISPDNGVFLMRQRVVILHPHQIGARHFAGLGTIQPDVFQKFFGQFFGHDVVFAGFFVLQKGVIFGVGHRRRHIGRDGPRGGGPYGQADGFGIVQIAQDFTVGVG